MKKTALLLIIFLWLAVTLLALALIHEISQSKKEAASEGNATAANLTCLSAIRKEGGLWLIENKTIIFNGCTALLEPVIISTNSLGLRDREHFLEKPENTKRIIALGDSVTFGWGLELEDSWVKQLELLLNDEEKNLSYEVMNFGVPGLGTKEEAALLESKGMQFHPDIIIITVIGNDWEDDETRAIQKEYIDKLEKEACAGDNSCNLSQEGSLSQYLLAQDYMRDELTNVSWKSMEDGFRDIYGMSKNITVLLGYYPFNKAWQEKILSLAGDFNWTAVDLKKFYRDEKYRLKGSLDPHPNKLASKEIAIAYYEVLKRFDLLR